MHRRDLHDTYNTTLEEESAEGKRKYKRKKPKNKRARYQQISDSSDSSDMNDDSDNDSMNDQTREEQAENRKGVGWIIHKGVIHRVTRGISPTGRNHRILSTSATTLPNTSIINLN